MDESLWQPVNETTIRVNLSHPPRLPLDHYYSVAWSKGESWVTVERRGDDMFVDDRKVILFIAEEQRGQTGHILGTVLMERVAAMDVLHPNIITAMDEAEMHGARIRPVGYRENDGASLTIFFPGAAFYFHPDGGTSHTNVESFQYMQWGVSAWRSEVRRPNYRFFENDVIAILEPRP